MAGDAPTPTKTKPDVVEPRAASTATDTALQREAQDSLRNPFNQKYSDLKQQEEKEGWNSKDNNAKNLYAGMTGDFERFDAAAGGVTDAQKPPAGPFSDVVNADKSVTRSYKGMEGVQHKFNADGSVELTMPKGFSEANGLGDVTSVKFNGDQVTVTPPAEGKVLSPEEAAKLNTDISKVFGDKVNGEFKANGGTGNWRLDAQGNSVVDNVPGMPNGTTMSVRHPNAEHDVKYKGTTGPRDGRPGYSTEATGTPENGMRFVDLSDEKVDGVQALTTKKGETIEGLVGSRQGGKDQTPLAMVSDRPAGDGSETIISADGKQTTTFGVDGKPDASGRLTRVDYPPGHKEGMVSQETFDPAVDKQGRKSHTTYAPGDTMHRQSRTVYDPTSANNPEGLASRAVSFDPTINERQETTARITKNATTDAQKDDVEVTARQTRPDLDPNRPGVDVTTRKLYENTAAAQADTPYATTMTKRDGSSVSVFNPPREGGVSKVEYSGKPGEKPVLTGADNKPITDQKLIDQYTRDANHTPPVISETKTGDTTRKVYADGVVEETGRTEEGSSYKRTETATQITTEYDPPRQTSDKLTQGLKKSVEEKSGPNQGVTHHEYDPTQNETGVKSADSRTDSQGRTTTEYNPTKDGQPGSTEVRDANGKLLYSRDVSEDGNTVTTTDHTTGRKETRDYKNNEYSITDKDGNTISKGKIVQQGNRRLLVDSTNGSVMGMDITSGPNAGQSYSFDRNPDGSLKRMEMTVPGQPDQKVTLERTPEGFKVDPPEAKIPGFKTAVADKNGMIKGDFKAYANGDMLFESTDANSPTKEMVRNNGDREVHNSKDYSRVRETADGKVQPTEYWDGYKYREGTINKELSDPANGKYVVDFKGTDGPTRTTRDSKGNGFSVEFANGVKYSTSSWESGVMTMTKDGKTSQIGNSGVRDSKGNLVHPRGEMQADGTFDFTKAEENKAAIEAGDLPMSMKVVDGKQVATYKDGRTVVTDLNGNQTEKAADGSTIRRSFRDAEGRQHVVDARGQDWKMTDAGNPNAKPPEKPTWEMRGKKIKGDMQRFTNGNVGIDEGRPDKLITMLNPDESSSLVAKDTGIERERHFKDGSYIKRNENGTLAETKDKDGNTTSFKYNKDNQDGRPDAVIKTDKTGKIVGQERRDKDGQLREVTYDAAGNPTFGNRVQYLTGTGGRIEVEPVSTPAYDGAPDKTKQTITNLNGTTQEQVFGESPIDKTKSVLVRATGPKGTVHFQYSPDGKQISLYGGDGAPQGNPIGHYDEASQSLVLEDGTKVVLDPDGVLVPADSAKIKQEHLDPSLPQKLQATPEALDKPAPATPGEQAADKPLDAAGVAELAKAYDLKPEALAAIAQGLGGLLPEGQLTYNRVNAVLNVLNQPQHKAHMDLFRQNQDKPELIAQATTQLANTFKQIMGSQDPNAALQQLAKHPEGQKYVQLIVDMYKALAPKQG